MVLIKIDLHYCMHYMASYAQKQTSITYCETTVRSEGYNYGHIPCPAELFQLSFLSFEAGIAKQFPASNDETYLHFFFNMHLLN